MARISTYNTDENVVALDKWIGTRADGSVTKNFSAQGIADFLNNTSAVTVAGQNNFFFQTNLAEGRAPGTISFTSGGGSNTAFASLTTIKISKYASSGYIILNYLQTLVDQAVFIAQTDNVNNFGIYKLLTLEQDIIETDFYNATFQLIQSNGALLVNHFYAFSVYPGFISYPFASPASSLQQVTDVGNTTTNDIVLNSYPGKYDDYTAQNTLQDLGLFGSMSSPTDENYTSYYGVYGFGVNASLGTLSKSISAQESTFYLSSSDGSNANYNGSITLDATDGLGSAFLRLYNKLGAGGYLKATNLTNNVTLQFPNKATGTYTIATTADISTPTLQQVLDNNHNLNLGRNFQGTNAGSGNTGISVNAFGSNTLINNTGNNVNAFGNHSGADNNFNHINLFGYEATADGNNQTVFSKYITAYNKPQGRLSFNNITADRKWELPDASGTIALTSDIPSLTGYVPTSRTLTINGTTYDLTADRSWTITAGVSSVTATSPITSSGGATPVISTSMATNKLIGRSTAGTGVMEEITIGTGLTLSGGVLNGSATGVTSVGLSMPSAFTVTNSPVISTGTLTVTGAGLVSQYIRGDGTLANFPASTGGGASVSYYLNGSVSQGTIGGNAYKQINSVPIIGAGTDFTISADGYIAQFITDAGDPSKLLIPAGNWNFETYFSASSGGGSPRFYIELYKYNGTTFTLIASNSATPEYITGGTAIDLYFTAIAVPTTTLLITDRLAVRFYVINSGRTITMHTEDNHLSQIITTFSTGLTALNGLTAQVQNFAVGTTGTDFAISSTGTTHTFNLPTASATNRGALSSANWTTFNAKPNLGLVQAMTVGLQNIF